jgi:hypothetical protein
MAKSSILALTIGKRAVSVPEKEGLIESPRPASAVPQA